LPRSQRLAAEPWLVQAGRVTTDVPAPLPARHFIRDDDVGELTEPLRFFVETFFERELPVSYQIIPARLTRETADYLLGKWNARPDLIEFGQHGFTHSMVVGGKQVWREFGPERSYQEQSSDIREGLEIIRSHLSGGPPVTTFTPPQHKYDGATVRAAAAAGHRIFSGSSYPSRRHQIAYRLGRMARLSSLRHHGISYHGSIRPEAPMRELSISVAVDNGGDLLCAAPALGPVMGRASGASPIVGLMFHHQVYACADRRAALVAIADRLAAMHRAEGSRFDLMQPIARQL
jgi:hypothetical protein